MDLGELKVRISADIAQLSSGLQKAQAQVQSAGSKMQSAGKGMMKVGGAMSAAVTLPILAMGKMGLDELKQIEAANAQTAASIARIGKGSLVSVGGVQALAGELQRASGIDDQMIQSAQNAILTLGNLDVKTREGAATFEQASRAAVNMSEALGMDVGAAGKQVAKSMAAASQGVLLLPRGMKLTGAEQQRLEKLMKSGASSAQKQAAVMAVLGKRFEGAAKLTSTEKWAVAKDQLAGIAATLVSNLMPAVSKITDWVGKLAAKFEELSPTTQKYVAIGLAVAAALGPLIVVVGAIVSAIGVLIPVIAAVSLPMLAIVAAVALVIAAGVLLYKHWDTVKAKLAAAWNAIKSGVVAAFTAVKNFVQKHAVLIATVLMGPIGGLVVWVIKNWGTLRDKTSEIWGAIKSRAASAWDGLRDNIVNIAKAIPGAVVSALSSIDDKLGALGRSAGAAFASALKGAINAVIGAWNGLSIPGFKVSLPGGKSVGIDGVSLPNLPTFARGGITNGPSIAGEAGREAVIPLGSSRQNAVDRGRVMGELGMGGAPMEVHIHCATGMDPAMQSFVSRLANGGNAQGRTANRMYSGRVAV